VSKVKPPISKESCLYPLHEKLKEREREARTIGEFLDFLESEEVVLAEYGYADELHYWKLAGKNESIIGKFLDIDPVGLEMEKREMLDKLQKAQK